MKVGIVANRKIKDAIEIAKRAIKVLDGKADIVIDNVTAHELGIDGIEPEKMDVDVIITVGGDGTILRLLQENPARILGINAGDIGFLTSIMRNEIEEKLERLLSGDYVIDKRIRLKTILNGKRLPDSVNEAVIYTSQISKIRRFRVDVDGMCVMDVRADGVIVATPTGSTCYAMSVGGPIIDPRLDAFVLVPIAPFKKFIRPTIAPAGSKIEINVDEAKDCVLVLDGNTQVHVGSEDLLTMTISEESVEFIRFDSDFYKRIDKRLNI